MVAGFLSRCLISVIGFHYSSVWCRVPVLFYSLFYSRFSLYASACLHDCSDSPRDFFSVYFILLYLFPVVWPRLAVSLTNTVLFCTVPWLPQNSNPGLRPSSALSNVTSSFKRSDGSPMMWQSWTLFRGSGMGTGFGAADFATVLQWGDKATREDFGGGGRPDDSSHSSSVGKDRGRREKGGLNTAWRVSEQHLQAQSHPVLKLPRSLRCQHFQHCTLNSPWARSVI